MKTNGNVATTNPSKNKYKDKYKWKYKHKWKDANTEINTMKNDCITHHLLVLWLVAIWRLMEKCPRNIPRVQEKKKGKYKYFKKYIYNINYEKMHRNQGIKNVIKMVCATSEQ